MAGLLATKAGGTLSLQSLQQDLKIAFGTARDWVEALEAVYFGFRIRPYAKKLQGALHKEPKFYLYNWAAVPDEGARLENLVACHLLESCHAWTDVAMGHFELGYVKDKQKREVDFIVLRDASPWLLVEVKSSAREPTDALKYYTERLKPAYSVQIGEKPGK